MVRHPNYRQNKYIAKIDPDIVKQRFEAQKDIMTEQTAIVFSNQEQFEIAIGKFLNDLGLYGIELHHYRNYAQQLYSLTRRFWTKTLKKEATLVAKTWKSRGLNPEILKEIAKFFGIELEEPL